MELSWQLAPQAKGAGWQPAPLLECVSEAAHASAVADARAGAAEVIYLCGKTPGEVNVGSLGEVGGLRLGPARALSQLEP